MSGQRLGRPTREAAAGLAGRILDAATALFLRDGYAATSMEAVAATAAVSKRTLYKRYPDKASLLRESISRMVARWLPGFDQALVDESGALERTLLAAARRIHDATLAPEALALYRLLVAESGRFPEIGQAVREAGITIGITRVAALLGRYPEVEDPIWAAEQFQRLVLSGPQWRALGFDSALNAAELEQWARRCVEVFLRGIGLAGELQSEQPPRHAADREHGERIEFRERQHD